MKKYLFGVASILLISILTGCAVEANKPLKFRKGYQPKRPDILVEHKDENGLLRPPIYSSDNGVAIFFHSWDEVEGILDSHLDLQIKFQEAGVATHRIDRLVERYRGYIKNDITIAHLFISIVSNEDLLLKRGKMEFTFADGSVARDSGTCCRRYIRGPEECSFNEPLVFPGDLDGPRKFWVMLPREHFGSRVVSLRLLE